MFRVIALWARNFSGVAGVAAATITGIGFIAGLSRRQYGLSRATLTGLHDEETT
jgi:hypothetical protein